MVTENLNKKDYLFTYVIAKDPQYTEIVYEKMTSKDEHFISFNNFDSGKYYWRVHGTNKTTLTKTNYLTGYVDFVYQQPPTTESCCPKNLTSDPAANPETAEFIIDTDASTWVYDQYGERSISGSECAWGFFWNNWGNCGPWSSPPPYFSSNQTVSWHRTDNLKMIANSHVRILFGSCYGPCTCYFEGSENGTTWTTIATMPCDNWDYTYTLTQQAVYTYFRIRVGSDTKIKRIEVD